MNLSNSEPNQGLNVVVLQPEIYLDAAATTPPLPEVLKAMQQVHQQAWANPSSLHGSGVAAAEALERARWSLSRCFAVQPDQLIVTSGATESVHLALLGASATRAYGRVVISAVEHPAVIAAARRLEHRGWQLDLWPVDRNGVIDLNHLDRLLSPPTSLVSLTAAQSEVGSLQPICTIAKACRELGILFHTDATQLASQGCFDFSRLGVDLLSLSAHKCQGPRGVGLLIRDLSVELEPLQGGGGQEGGLRSGTEPVALVAGMARAMAALPQYDPQIQLVPPGSTPEMRRQRDSLLGSLLDCPGLKAIGADPNHRLPHHIALLVGTPQGEPLAGRSVVRGLAELGVACSSGSACSSGQSTDSPVLTAMGVHPDWRQSGLRLSLGPWLDPSQLLAIPKRIDAVVRSFS